MFFRHYSYTSGQKVVTGVVRAKTGAEARQALQARHLEPVIVQRFDFLPRLTHRVRQLDILFFLKNLSLFLKSGMTLGDALEESSKLLRSRTLQKVIAEVAGEVNAGNSLTNTLQKYQSVFSLATINLLRVGEESGTIADLVDRVARQEDQMFELRKKIRAAAAYPLIIVSITVILLVFFFILVLPRFNTLFLSIGTGVPPSVAAFIAIGRFFSDYGWMSALLSAAMVYCFITVVRLPRVATVWQRLLLKLPVASSLMKSYNLATISRIMAVLISSGIDVVKAFRIAAESVNNTAYARSLLSLSLATSSGQSIASSMGQFPDLYPSLVTRVVHAGEKSGSLGNGLDYLGQFYLRELDYSTRTLTTIIEPIMLLIVGIIIGSLALSIITPIYDFVATVGQ